MSKWVRKLKKSHVATREPILLFFLFCFCFCFCFFLSHAFALFWSTTVQSFLSEDGRKQFKEDSCCRHVFQNTRVKLIPWRAIFSWCSTWQSVATVTLFTLRRPFEFVNEESPAVTNGDVKGKRTALASVLAAVVTEIDRSFHGAFSYCGCTIKPTRKLSPALRNRFIWASFVRVHFPALDVYSFG